MPDLRTTRRHFTAGAIASAIAPLAGAPSSPRLRPLAYSQVKLTSGPLAAMHGRIHRHFLGLDEDRLLKVYRQRAGLPAPGRDMGGWYDADGFVPGHLLGQIVSGLSRLYANTGDAEAADKARRLVRGYAEALAKDGDPYASPKASTWACYILDKYIVGLLDAVHLAGVEEARGLIPRVIAAAAKSLPDRVHDRVGVKNLPYDEPYVLPENLFGVWQTMRDPKLLNLAKLYLLDRDFFDPLARGENVLPGRHGYSHVVALSSAAKAYEVLGDAKYLRAIRNAWDFLEQTQQYASGAWAPQEMFVKPDTDELADSLTATRDHFETPCCFYAYAKLARYLTSFTGDARYGDGLERALLNTILGALDPDDDGGYFYYSSYHARSQKGYYARKWPCCAGTLLQSVADFPLDLYFEDDHGVYVNLYAASELKWKFGRIPVTITQETAFPESERVSIRVEPERPAKFALRLRIPAWAEGKARVTVNGAAVPGTVIDRPGWATIERQWRTGDRVDLTLPFSFRTVPIDARHPNIVAAMKGPVVMTAIDLPEDLTVTAQSLASVAVRPFYRVQRETYTTYFRIG